MNTNNHTNVRQEEERVKALPNFPMERRGMRPMKGISKMIVGKDISLEQIPDYLSHALVRNFCGKVMARATLEWWI